MARAVPARRETHTWLGVAAAAGFCAALLACRDRHDSFRPREAAPEETILRSSGFLETGDLDALKRRGKLRILAPLDPAGERALPRDGSPLDFERDAAADFARSIGLEPILIPMVAFEDASPMLVRGEADILATDLTVTEERKTKVAFSLPFDHVRARVVTRASDTKLRRPADLVGRIVTVDPSTVFWDAMLELRKKYPGIVLKPEPLAMNESILDRVASGAVDVTVHQSNLVEAYLPYRRDLRAAFDVSEARPVAWAVRRDAPMLREALNGFLNREHLVGVPRAFHVEDLPRIERRGVLRVLLRNSAVSYYLWKGELVGFEYDLVKEFARRHGLKLRVIVPPSHADLFRWLVEGRGDIAAGFLSPTEQTLPGVAFTRPYHHGSQWIVKRADDPIDAIEELRGRKVAVRRTSPYWRPLERLRREGVHFDLLAAPEDMETEELILGVGRDDLDLTVAGGPIADLDLDRLENVALAFPIGGPVPSAWAVRLGNRKLRKAIDAFFEEEVRGVFFNVTYERYFRKTARLEAHMQRRIDPASVETLSPFDEIARRHAERHELDWRLVVSQMYEESQFDPKRVSPAGARGLMQILPRTARELGCRDVHDPEDAIDAGVKYLAWLRDRFESDLPYTDRMWFALAAYNTGLGHVDDARRLAPRMGLDPNRWFGHVERAMLLLASPKHAAAARFGFARGSEPVRYVQAIRERYDAYRAER